MKRKILSLSMISVMLITVLSGFCTVASATTVTDMSDFIIESATPQTLGRWDGSGYTYTESDGTNGTRSIAYSGTSTSSHVSLSIPQSAVNDNPSAKPYILHLSYRIQNDRTNPAYITHRMQYKQSGGSGSFSDLFVTDESTFTMNPDNSLNITSANAAAYNNLDLYDYKIDLYENLKTGAYQVYLNGVKWISAYDYSTEKNMFGNGSYTINEYRIRVTGAANSSWAFNLVNPCYELYSEDVMMDEVIAYSVSGMSNYLNATGPSDTAQSKIDSTSGTITLSPSAGTSSSSYSATGVSSGAKLIWWTGDESQGTGHKPKFSAAGVVSGKEWFHMGFNITGSNVGIQLGANLYRTDNGKTATWDILDGYTGSNYRVDYVFDLEHSLCYQYYNNVFDSVKNDDFVKQIRQIQLKITTSTDFTISNVSFKYYAKCFAPGDILAGYDARTNVARDYVYQISGIKSGEKVIGKVDGLCNITGDNTNGYTIQPNSVNVNNGGFARFYLGYTSDTGISQCNRVLHQSFYYKPAAVSTKQSIGIRGNNGYEYLLWADPATGCFEDGAGNTIKSYSTNTFYKVDYILNNYDYKYYFLLDGVCVESGTLSSGRRPIWQMVYTSRSTSDYMIIKDLTTTLYKDNYTTASIVTPLLSEIYADIESCSVSSGTASVTSSFIGPTTNTGANTKIYYVVYDANGRFLDYAITENASAYVNGSNPSKSVTVPAGGAKLKVFMWNLDMENDILQNISNPAVKSLQ